MLEVFQMVGTSFLLGNVIAFGFFAGVLVLRKALQQEVKDIDAANQELIAHGRVGSVVPVVVDGGAKPSGLGEDWS